MATEQTVFEYKRFGFSFTVYTNRIEVIDGAFISLAKKDTILLKNIADVAVKGLTRRLYITLNSGVTKEYNIGTQSEAAKTAIQTAL